MRTTPNLLQPIEGFEPLAISMEEHLEVCFLFDKTPLQLNLQWLQDHPGLLNFLVNNVARDPKNLVLHIQRIVTCYQANLHEHLYGAVTDLFMVLEGCALEFKTKLLPKLKPKLSDAHYRSLEGHLQKNDLTMLYWLPNSFAVTSKGLLGTTQLMVKLADDEVEEELELKHHDPLQLAQEYIEYGDFYEAQSVLEEAILQEAQRKELHVELLALYKSLQDIDGFVMYSEILEHHGNPFPALWQQVADFFINKNLLTFGRSSTD